MVFATNTIPKANLLECQPIYDNTLGVLSLLETPKVFYSKDAEATNDDGIIIKRDFRIVTNDLKYALNPAAGLRITEIKAALVFNATTKYVGEVTFENPYSTPVKINQGKITNGKSTLIIQTPFIPLECLNNYTVNLAYRDGFVDNLETDVRLQLIVLLERIDNPSQKQAIFMSQYKTELATQPYPLEGNELSKMPINVIINELNLTEDKVIKAWESVKLNGNIQTNGHKLIIIAGQNIDVLNPTDLSPSIELMIAQPDGCNAQVLPQTPKQLFSFCNSKKYDPIVPTSREKPENDSIVAQKELKTMLNVVPNPFENRLVIHFTLQEESNGSLSLTNAIGQVIKIQEFTQKSMGEYQEIIATNDIAPGVYYLTLQTKFGVETKKIVKQL